MIKPCGMEDLGTRLEHMMQLQDVWSTAYALLTAQGWHSIQEKEQAKELTIALRLLAQHMTNDYSDLGIARTVNDLPKNAKEIPNEPK